MLAVSQEDVNRYTEFHAIIHLIIKICISKPVYFETFTTEPQKRGKNQFSFSMKIHQTSFYRTAKEPLSYFATSKINSHLHNKKMPRGHRRRNRLDFFFLLWFSESPQVGIGEGENGNLPNESELWFWRIPPRVKRRWPEADFDLCSYPGWIIWAPLTAANDVCGV